MKCPARHVYSSANYYKRVAVFGCWRSKRRNTLRLEENYQLTQKNDQIRYLVRATNRVETTGKNDTTTQDGPQSTLQGKSEHIPLINDHQRKQLTTIQLNNPDLFKDKSLVNGEWVEAKSGKRFDVYGKSPQSRFYTDTTNSNPQQTQATERYGRQPRTTSQKTPTQPSRPPMKRSKPSAKSAPGPVPSACLNGIL